MFDRFFSRCICSVFTSFLIVALVPTFCTAAFAQSDKASIKKPVILIVGTYHLGDDREDVTTPERQKQIEELVALLKKFRPTKVAVEVLFDNSTINERFGQYLDGKYQLSHNESDQIGFRLAKELKHPKVYPIDWKNKFDLLPVIAYANSNNQGAIIQKGIKSVTEFDQLLGKMMKTSTLLEMFRFLNSDKMVKEVDHAMLTTLVHIGKDGNYIGTDVLADWYERNLKIFTNLTRIIESDDDRILVIIGNGHVNLLRQFIEESGQYVLEKPEKYIKST